MSLQMVIIWLKRATGIGYEGYPPLAHLIDQDKAKEMEEKSRTLAQEVDFIEHLMTRGGHSESHR